jgi:hypothetical protein
LPGSKKLSLDKDILFYHRIIMFEERLLLIFKEDITE